MTLKVSLSRRSFLVSSAVLTSGLVVGCSSGMDVRNLRFDQSNTIDIDYYSWIQILPSGETILTIPSVEMGQAVSTSMAQIIAEELDADWQQIRVRMAPYHSDFNNPDFSIQMTGGSTSIKAFYQPLRLLGAATRDMLLQAASIVWGVSKDSLTTEMGYVKSSSLSASYQSLAEMAASLKAPRKPQLKTPDQFSLIGQPKKRLDSLAKVTGQAEFGVDVELDNMLVATLVQAPVFQGKPLEWQDSQAREVSGVVDIFAIPDAVVVVAEKYWQASKAARLLQIQFTEPETTIEASDWPDKYRKTLNNLGKQTLTHQKQLDLEYQVPFLAHATLEPMNCTAHVQSNRVDIWVPTQSQTLTADVASQLTGIKKSNVFVHTTFLGGGFGRRGEIDFVVQAVQISKRMKRPVKLIWSREQDMQHDFYRPGVVTRLQIGLDKQGNIDQWHQQLVSSSILKRFVKYMLPNGLKWLPVVSVIGDPSVQEGSSDIPYVSGDEQVDVEFIESPFPVGFWRSVGHSYTAFFKECAVDEVANLTTEDPYRYRYHRLKAHPREQRVLEQVASAANWGKVPENHFQGIAVQHCFESYIAMVVEITVSATKQYRIERITAAVDCGTVVNPGHVEAQIVGGAVFGLTAAIHGEIHFDQGRVRESNFHDYSMLKMADMPEFHVVIIDSNETPTGIGEVGTPPIAPALVNAIFAASGERIRQLPIINSGWRMSSPQRA